MAKGTDTDSINVKGIIPANELSRKNPGELIPVGIGMIGQWTTWDVVRTQMVSGREFTVVRSVWSGQTYYVLTETLALVGAGGQ